MMLVCMFIHTLKCVSLDIAYILALKDQEGFRSLRLDGGFNILFVMHHPRGVEVGILGGSKNQKSGKCHELSRKSKKN